MALRRFVVVALTGVAAAVGFVGCVDGSAPRPAAKREDALSGVRRQASTRGVVVAWQEPGPDGMVRPVLEMEAVTGTFDSGQQSGELRKATGTFYRDGRARARFSAPIVHADRAKHRVVARGGVVVTSIDPPGITVRTARLTWHPEKDTVVAEGNVWFQHIATGTVRPAAEGGPFERVTFDTRLEKVVIPPSAPHDRAGGG